MTSLTIISRILIGSRYASDGGIRTRFDESVIFKSNQAPKRSNSLAGRVMSSLARLGRKGTVKTSTDEMDDEEEIFNNNRNTPVFVMPEDQVDVIDKGEL